ncbi:MAG: PAS domain S-box protein [Candidatus Pacearchaeota archaeon]|jgi:PAS domain S-box-containing protein
MDIKNILNGDLLKYCEELIFVFDNNKRFIFCHISKSMQDLLLFSPEYFLGKIYSEIMPEFMNNLFNDSYEKNQLGESATYDYEIIINGNKRFFSSRQYPIFDSQLFIGAIAFIRDITQRKQFEEEMAHQKKELEIINKYALNRELNNIELKKEINELLSRLGEDKKYNV